VTEEERLSDVRTAARRVERFAYRAVSEAIREQDVRQARTVMRLAVGLRRLLDRWRNGHGEEHAG
jgi:hypothetical protein